MKIIEFDLTWIHLAPYALILRQDEAIWLRIIFIPVSTHQKAVKDQTSPKENSKIKKILRSKTS